MTIGQAYLAKLATTTQRDLQRELRTLPAHRSAPTLQQMPAAPAPAAAQSPTFLNGLRASMGQAYRHPFQAMRGAVTGRPIQ